MKNSFEDFKEFELSDFQKVSVRGGLTFVSGYGSQGQTFDADTLTGRQKDQDAGGNADNAYPPPPPGHG